MKPKNVRIFLRLFILLAATTLIPGCFGGGGSSGGSDSAVGGSGLGPIVNADGDFASGTGVPGDVEGICPQTNEQLLGLEIADIRNDHGLIGAIGDEQNTQLGLEIFMGNEHWPFGDMVSETPTEVDLRVTRPDTGVSLISTASDETNIHMVLLGDYNDFQSGLISELPKLATILLEGPEITETGLELAYMDDGSPPSGRFQGSFDLDSPTPSLNFLDKWVILQVCDTTVNDNGVEKTVSSNPTLVRFSHGIL